MGAEEVSSQENQHFVVGSAGSAGSLEVFSSVSVVSGVIAGSSEVVSSVTVAFTEIADSSEILRSFYSTQSSDSRWHFGSFLHLSLFLLAFYVTRTIVALLTLLFSILST